MYLKCNVVSSVSLRDHIFQLYRGQMTFSQDVFVSPARLVVGLHYIQPRKLHQFCLNLWHIKKKIRQILDLTSPHNATEYQFF